MFEAQLYSDGGVLDIVLDEIALVGIRRRVS